MILAVTGLQREARIARRAGRRWRSRAAAITARLASDARCALAGDRDGIISIGIAGALAPALQAGRLGGRRCGHRRRRDDADRSRLDERARRRACPARMRGLLLGSDAIVATAAHKAGAASRDRRARRRHGIARRGRASPRSTRPAVRGRAGDLRCGRPHAAAGGAGGMRAGRRHRPAGRAAIAAARARGRLPALIRTGAGGRARRFARLLRGRRSAWCRTWRPGSSASFCSTWREKTNSAGRWLRAAMSCAIAPSVRTPRIATAAPSADA